MDKREICQIGFRLGDCKNLLSQEILNVTAEANFISVTFYYFIVLFPYLSISTLERDLVMSFLRSDDWCEQRTLRKLIVIIMQENLLVMKNIQISDSEIKI